MQNDATPLRVTTGKPANTSNSATSMAVQANTQHDQIMAALDTLGIKLIKSEAEREMLKKLVEETRLQAQRLEKALETSRTELASAKKDLDTGRKEIETAKSKQDVMNERVKEAQSQVVRLARRIEADDQKRSRLTRRMERLETVAEEAQAALQARAMVLLTDRTVAEASGMPYLPATGDMPAIGYSGNNNARMQGQNLTVSDAGTIEMGGDMNAPAPWHRRKSSLSNTTAMVAAAAAVIFGWAISQSLNQPPAIAVLNDGTLARVNLKTGAVEPLTFNTKQLSAPKADTDAATAPAATAPQTAQPATPATVTANGQPKPTMAELEAMQPRDTAIPAALGDLQAKAYQGQAEAQHDLAALYTAGQGVKQDYARAAFWFRQAAAQGVANAAYNLGVLYHQGLGTTQNVALALDWYRLAALAGHPEAQYNLGIAYIEGIGTRYNPQLAASFFQSAALGGIVEAAYNLGLILENGLLGEPQPQKAALWYRAASDRGSLEARNALGQLALRLGEDQGKAGLLPDGTGLQKLMRSDADQAENTDGLAAIRQLEATSGGITQGIPGIDQVMTAQVQEQLNRRNLYSGSQEGTMGGKTGDAIRSYQKSNDLTVDGKASSALLRFMLEQSTFGKKS